MHPGPCLVFLDPAKKGLRYPNLKSKTSLHLQSKLTVTSTHLFLQSVLLLVNTVDPLLNTLINTAATHFSIFVVHQHLLPSHQSLLISAHHLWLICSSISGQSAHHYLVNLLITATQDATCQHHQKLC